MIGSQRIRTESHLHGKADFRSLESFHVYIREKMLTAVELGDGEVRRVNPGLADFAVSV